LTALGRRPTQSYSGGFSLATDAPPARLTLQPQQVVLNPWIREPTFTQPVKIHEGIHGLGVIAKTCNTDWLRISS
jgi:hypothetical protein